MKHRKRIFSFLNKHIKSVEVISSSGPNRPGKDTDFYEHVSIVLNNEKNESFLLEHTRGYSMPRSTSKSVIEIENFPIQNSAFYPVCKWISEEYDHPEIINILKHLEAFEFGIFKKKNLIDKLNAEIRRIEKHLDSNLYYWGFIENINSFSRHEKPFQERIMEIYLIDGKKEVYKTSNVVVGIKNFNGYELIDCEFCHLFEILFTDEFRYKKAIIIPKEFIED